MSPPGEAPSGGPGNGRRRRTATATATRTPIAVATTRPTDEPNREEQTRGREVDVRAVCQGRTDRVTVRNRGDAAIEVRRIEGPAGSTGRLETSIAARSSAEFSFGEDGTSGDRQLVSNGDRRRIRVLTSEGKSTAVCQDRETPSATPLPTATATPTLTPETPVAGG